MYGHFLSFLAITIDQLRPKFHCVSNYIHPSLAYCSQSTPLHDYHPCNHRNINCRSDWRDQGRIERGTLGTFGCEKIVLIFTVKNMLKFENFRKCTPEMYLSDF